METKNELTVVEQPQELITIEPKKYVELVFEPFAKQYADAVDAVREVAYDIKTTIGMATAVKHRAVFRDIRVASEKARKLRKAPIIEIGKLLDSRQGEVEGATLPFETMFDDEIKAEESRKEIEKQAKLNAERERVKQIREIIDYGVKAYPTSAVGLSAAKIAAMLETLEAEPITLERYQEFSGEAEVVKAASIVKLREMLTAQQAHEAEAQRLAEERAALEAERRAQAERDRIAAEERAAQEAKDRAARLEQERRDREAREQEEADRREAQRRAQEAMDAEREAHEARMAEQRAAADKLNAATSEIQGIQQQVIIAQMGRAGVRKGGTIECLRDTLAETEAWDIDPERFGILAGAAESAKTTAVAEIRRLLTEAEAKEREDAEARRQREEAERAAAIEAQRIAEAAAAEAARLQAEKEAAEREQIRRVRVQFEKNGPGDGAIVIAVADAFDVSADVALGWLAKFNAAAFADQKQEQAA